MLLAVPIAAAVIFLAALPLAIFALRGRRIDTHPLCRRCGYDLFAQPKTSTRCPECGHDITTPRSTRLGHRQRRPALLILSIILLFPSLTLLGTTTWITTHNINLDPYKPVWLLLHESRTGSTTALPEMRSRLKAGKLSSTQLSTIVDRVLEVQADRAKPWDKRWLEFISAAQSANLFGEERWQRYWEQTGGVALKVRKTVSRSDPRQMVESWVYFDRGTIPNAAVNDTFSYRLTIPQLDFAGIPCDTSKYYRYESSSVIHGGLIKGFQTMDINLPPDRLSALTDGPQVAHAIVNVVIYDTHDNHVIATIRKPTEATWTLLPASQPAITLIHDPAIASKMTAGWQVTLERDTGDQYSIRFEELGLPCDVAFHILARAGTKEWDCGELVAAAPGFNTYITASSKIPGLTAKSVDLILRPDTNAAMRSLDTTSIYGDEIILKNIPVKPAR